jgi:hypothetical protein
MSKVKIKQIEADVALNMSNLWTGERYKVTNIANPTEDYDAVNLRTLQQAISGTTTSLSGLTDVLISNPQDNQVLVYSGGTWYNIDYSGVTSLSELADVALTALSDNQFLMYSGGTWVNTSDLHIDSGDYIYMGDWRMYDNGTTLKIEKYVSGNWEFGGEFFV